MIGNMTVDPLATLVAHDPVAAAVEAHLQDMEAAGHGEFSLSREGNQIALAFGRVKARGETYDVALLRLACALLDSVDLCSLFFARMRNPALNPPAANSRDNLLGVRKAAGRR